MAAAAPAVDRPAPRDARLGEDPARDRAQAPLQHRARRARRCSGSCRRSGSSSPRSCPPSALASKGWWQIFSKPSLATWSNYDALFHNSRPHHRAEDDRVHRGRQHGPRRHPRRDGRLRVRLARLPGPRLGLHRRDRAARRAAADGADPDVQALRHARPLRHVVGIILFHIAFGLPFAIFLLRNFFVGIPKDILESARIDGASEIVHLRAADPAARPAGDRLARDLPVPLDVERPDRRADVRAEHDADHGLDRGPAARVRHEHRHHRAGLVHLARRSRSACSSPSSATSSRACWPAR